MSRHNVLVVEDDAEIRYTLVQVLEECGCEVVGRANGKAALQYLETAQKLPCLIFLDLMMPVMDGIAFREAQLRDPALAHIPVIILSAYRDLEQTASELKAATYLHKPPRIDDLLGAVQQHC